MTSPHLQAEENRLLTLMTQIRNSGSVAPAYCWLTETSETKGGKTYSYVRLVTERPGSKPTSRSLGKPGGERHRDWQAAIDRREAIGELEQQLKILRELVERQQMRWRAIDRWVHESISGR